MVSVDGSRSVIVRGYDFGTTHEQLASHMGSVGKIESIDPVLHSSGTIDKGAVRITYASAEEAKAAAQLQQTCITGNSRYIDVITLDPYAFLSEQNVDPERAQQFLALTPEQQNAVMAKGTLATARDPTAVLVQRMNQAREGGIQGFNLAEGGFNSPISDGRSVLVRGFDFGTTHQQIQGHMSSAGTIESIDPVPHASGAVDKGVVRINYASAEEAKAAVQLNQTIIAGNTRYIDVMLLDPKEFLAQYNFDSDKALQFQALTPEQQLAVMAKGSLSSARNPNAVLVTRMSQARLIGKSFGPASMKGNMGSGPYGGGGGDMNEMMMNMMQMMMKQMMENVAKSSAAPMGAMAGSSVAPMGAMAGSSTAPMGGMDGSWGAQMGAMAGSSTAPMGGMDGSWGAQMGAMAGSSAAPMGGMDGSFGAQMGGMDGSFGAQQSLMRNLMDGSLGWPQS